MPYKDPEKAKQHRKDYYIKNRNKLIKDKVEYNKVYQKTPYGKFMCQRKEAINERGLSWQLTFEEWWKIWEDSGHWEERGTLGYHMCRYGDEGPYSKENVYIAHHIQNKKDQWMNGHTFPPPRKKKKFDKESLDCGRPPQ